MYQSTASEREHSDKKIMLGGLDLGSHNIETPGQVSAYSRRTEIRRGRELETGTGLRHEILATRGRCEVAWQALRPR